jgi:two-component system, NarL family, sensor histidine kinase UhpB
MQHSESPQTPHTTTAAAEDRAPAPHDLAQALARAREVWRHRLSLHWRIFAVNALVLVIAALLLALAPVTIHAPIKLYELAILIGGVVLVLVADIALVRRTLEPLRRLASLMTVVDPTSPGRRAPDFRSASRETIELAEAFNAMLDRLENERRESSRRALAAQEDERMRIARELHDEIGQTLTAVALRAEHGAERAGGEHPEFAELAEIVQQSLADVRRISLELRPGALDELGLVNALISLCARVGDQSGMRMHRELAGPAPELSPEVELAVYRIAQEALTNAMRHSRASDATVSLMCANDELVLSVVDNGLGLPEDVVKGGGLTGMLERAMLIGADLEIEGAAGGGVSVTVRLPLNGGPACLPR